MRRDFAEQLDRMGLEILPLTDALNIVARNHKMCPGGITGFAQSTGRNVNTLAHKFDPAHQSHVLNLYDVLDLLRYVTPHGRAVLLDSLHAELGETMWFLVSPLQYDSVPANMLDGAGEVLRSAADAATTTAQVIADGKVDAQELAATRQLAHRIIQAAVGLYQRAARAAEVGGVEHG